MTIKITKSTKPSLRNYRKAVRRMLENGETIAEIAEALGASAEWIRRVAKGITYRYAEKVVAVAPRFACRKCAMPTTRKHSSFAFPCCESCEDAMTGREAFHVACGRS
jgi:hypothetical protein